LANLRAEQTESTNNNSSTAKNITVPAATLATCPERVYRRDRKRVGEKKRAPHVHIYLAASVVGTVRAYAECNV